MGGLRGNLFNVSNLKELIQDTLDNAGKSLVSVDELRTCETIHCMVWEGEAEQRITKFVDRMLQDLPPGQAVLLVTHFGPSGRIIKYLTEGSAGVNLDPRAKIAMGSVTELE